MSYILDALRRADAERERGEVPGIHAQQLGPLPEDDEADPRRRSPAWVIGGLALALVGALGWILFASRGAPHGEAVVRPAAESATAPIPAPAMAPPIAVPAPVPAVGTTPLSAPAVAARPGTVLPRTAAATVAGAMAPTRSASASASASPPRRAASAADAARARPASAPASSAADRIYKPQELPDAIRKELPTVTVSGSTYSGDRANRMLMINGQIFHEGDTISSGLVLQQIKPRGAVFAFKGYRYETAF